MTAEFQRLFGWPSAGRQIAVRAREESGLTASVVAAALLVLADFGPLADVEPAMRRADELLPDRDLLTSATLLLGLSYASLSIGQVDRALGYLERFPAQHRDLVRPIRLAPSWHSLMAQALTAAGRHQEALRHADLLLSRSDGTAAPEDLAHALRVRAAAEPDGFADTLCRRAIALLEGTDLRGELSRCYYALGSAQYQRDELPQARETLHQAIEHAQDGNLHILESRIRARLVAAGGRVRRPRPSGLAGLSACELTVARLAGQGKSNRQIAADLFIGVRTVEVHLTRTYSKLGIATRHELPKALEG